MLNPSSLHTSTILGSVPFTAPWATWKWVLSFFCIASHATYVTSQAPPVFLSASFVKMQIFQSFFHSSQDPELLLQNHFSEIPCHKQRMTSFSVTLPPAPPCTLQPWFTKQCLSWIWRFTWRMSICSCSLLKVAFWPIEVQLRTLFFTPAPRSPRIFVGVGSHFRDNVPASSSEKWKNLIIFILLSFHAAHFISQLKQRQRKDPARRSFSMFILFQLLAGLNDDRWIPCRGSKQLLQNLMNALHQEAGR